MKKYLITEQWLNFMNKDCIAEADASQCSPIEVPLDARVVTLEQVRKLVSLGQDLELVKFNSLLPDPSCGDEEVEDAFAAYDLYEKELFGGEE